MFTIIGIILILISIFVLCKGIKIHTQKTEQIKKNQQEIQKLKQVQQTIKNNVLNEKNKIEQLKIKQNTLRQEIDSEISSKRIHLDKLYSDLKDRTQQAFLSYESTLDQAYIQKDKAHKEKLKQIQLQQQQAKDKLSQTLETLQAAAAAKVREKELKEKESFYKIQISENQISDIEKLQVWKFNLYDPSIVSKIIWSTYLMKPTSSMCNRILGTSKVCGIYKITNTITNQCYIGQSLNISDRWKAHVKCGIGINASSSNKLYNAMQKDGVWNFTFEIIQKCSKNELNEKQRFWIQTYKADEFGMNSTKGNK